MLDIHWLKTFVTLAEYKHFGKAANALHMTQPNVSLQLKQLEQTTGVKLLDRNPFHLTQAGERLLQSSIKTLEELQVCQSDLNALNELDKGTITVAASDIISRMLLIGAFKLFRNAYPGMDIVLLNTTSSQAADLVKKAEADVGFVISQQQSQPLHFVELQQVKWVAFGEGFQQAIANQSEITLILLGHDTRTRDLIDDALPRLNLSNYRVMEVGSVDAQIDWAEAGFGVAIIPEFALSTKRNIQTDVTPLSDFPTTNLGYIVRQNQILSKATKQLLQWVGDEMIILQK
ncbi:MULTISPECIES: LysR family transcriptional regulator [Vibrio]|uniref:LysR family transcriptional regulator n=1 Tax=Vibrio mediterranei TaxID=689 RepID=A0ABX5DB33_9VIBR|nr:MULTISPECIES: LysR family transcriptional regulator [Vibrio]EDL53456.1 transcriptional regulator [Vibrio mediterranei AK1]KFA98726.1 LysR family transcriptional regulator [Vibrio sp. ER1A]MCF4172715.1 LysR family transcriptional regulator [Vibrio sp. McD22-P3]MCG9629154.1 LysR family transcriptional regulator [Vibrio mediterranei]MCG9661886.1 LysR family transcriptional regulator [Vibrio mediterranei]